MRPEATRASGMPEFEVRGSGPQLAAAVVMRARVWLVLPTYNEAANVEAIVEAAARIAAARAGRC